MIILAIQVVFGIYLRLHLQKGINARLRKYVVIGHGVLGKALPVVSWVQMLFGGITALGFCRDDHLGQCLAHFIMGSAFIGYGIILTIILLAGQFWLRRTGRSQEFFDSLLIATWGCVNTFTEHRWGGPWVKNDLQHTSMGILWWCAGLLGVWLSRKRDGSPKRNLIPGIVILITGWAMSAHPQGLELSTHVHTIFGYTLMAAGATRIVEISFVLKDQNSVSSTDFEETNSWQYLTPFVSYPAVPLSSSISFDYLPSKANSTVSYFMPLASSSCPPRKSKWPCSPPLMYLMFHMFSSFIVFLFYYFSLSPNFYIYIAPGLSQLPNLKLQMVLRLKGEKMDIWIAGLGTRRNLSWKV